MTDTETFLKAEPERDRWGRYLIVPRDGGKAEAHTRATTVAETLDDRFNLEQWKIRMGIRGVVASKSLYARAASLP